MPDRQFISRATTCSLLVYGSLMDDWELARCGLSFKGAQPVIVSGWRREFTQEPSWRRRRGKARGVLTVRGAEGSRVNAILVAGIPIGKLTLLDQRERGYQRCSVAVEQVEPFEPDQIPNEAGRIYTYEGRPEMSNSELEPNAEYLAVCLEAASAWGERFRQMFLQTTFVAGRPLGS